MKVTVRLFALFRERIGRDTVELDLPEGASVGDALAHLAREPRLGELIERMPVRLAVNRDYADEMTTLVAGDEVALVPPVSGGGEPRVHVRLTEETLSSDDLSDLVADPAAGAKVIFQGTTRRVTRLEYEAYVEMAEERIRRILDAVVATHGLTRAAAEHRIGPVPLAEASVIVAVSAPHRPEAFAGAREAIDTIKAEAPIWKKEVVEDGPNRGERWVGPQPPPDATGKAGM